MDRDRRQFFTNLLRHGARTLKALREETGRPEGAPKPESFFDSYESSYALTLAYPDEILLESARRAGIAVEGRERIEIVRELFAKQGG